jgi:DNA-binding NarL/FixJ family response regulator
MDENVHRSRPTRVMLVDDHALVRYGLRILIEATPTLEFAGEAADGEDALERYATLHPDVVLLDVMLPGMSGVETVRALRRIDAQARIVMLTSSPDGVQVRAALEAGALSFVYKDVSIDALIKTVMDAHDGRANLSPAAARALIDALREPELVDYRLTPSELDVLRWVAQGYSNTQIAARLVVSTSTVKKHVSSILTKLKANNRAEAAAWAVRHKLSGL